ncbi:hypothetical protein CHS0354_025480 [Potamilus streckersoni]|uniref:Uncharacterized protein n=1 Tax=Potamilus streckersoni TaxID=2493646 RepID=A0AAE0VIR6_9BIVA|nr:hypothetical protein CHS0354_025480 [Potamilus streckersoni]
MSQKTEIKYRSAKGAADRMYVPKKNFPVDNTTNYQLERRGHPDRCGPSALFLFVRACLSPWFALNDLSRQRVKLCMKYCTINVPRFQSSACSLKQKQTQQKVSSCLSLKCCYKLPHCLNE